MAYTDIVNATQAVKDRVSAALLKQAAVRGAAVADGTSNLDQNERKVSKLIISGTLVTPFVTMVLIVLDISGTLSTATDAQIDTAITTANTGAWNYIVKSYSGS